MAVYDKIKDIETVNQLSFGESLDKPAKSRDGTTGTMNGGGDVLGSGT